MTGVKAAPTLDEAIQQVDAMLSTDGVAPRDALERDEGFGRYEGLPPQVDLLDDGRSVRLRRALTYHAEEGDAWPVPEGIVADGASIPRAFWTLIGGPFEGRYRNASIVHDHFCVTKDRSWAAVHRMFYGAMRCSGVGRAKAGVMYYAVYRFGPRWPGALEALGRDTASLAKADPSGIVEDARRIVDRDLDPDEIAALADRRGRDGPSREELP